MSETETENKPVKKRRRWWRWPLRALLLLVVTFAIFRFTVHQRVQNRLNAIRAAGYPVTLEELDAWYEYPDGPNAADVCKRAFEAYMGNKQFEETLPLIGHRIKYGPGEKLPSDVADRVVYYLEQNAKAVSLLKEAAQIEGCRYPAEITKGFDAEQNYRGQLLHGVKLFKLKAAIAIDKGRFGPAAEHVVSQLNLINTLRNEPFLLSSTTISSTAMRDTDQIEHLIRSGALNDQQLKNLALAISDFDIAHALHIGLMGERCIGGSLFFDPIETLDLEATDIGAIVLARLWQLSGLWDMDHAYYLSSMRQYVDYAANPEWKSRHQRLPVYDDEVPEVYRISRIIYPSAFRIIRNAQRAEAKQAVLLTAIAVQRYHQKYGFYPKRLNGPIPEFLSAAPKDSINDQTILYRVVDEGAIVYSRGTDGLDNMGRPYDEEGCPDCKESDISFFFGKTAEELWPIPNNETLMASWVLSHPGQMNMKNI